MNRWKFAFFVQLVLSIVAIGFLAYAVVDQGVTLTYGRVGSADVSAHRDILNSLMVGRITKAEIKANDAKALHDEGDYSYPVGIKDVRFQYDAKGRYLASSLGASSTKGCDPNKD